MQPEARGLCDALFRALPLIAPTEQVLVGLPDTIWFPEGALATLPHDQLSFLLFPVERPELFDAVVLDGSNGVREIQVKKADASSSWIWGAFKLPGAILGELFELWRAREPRDEYLGTLVNAWLSGGGRAYGVPAGERYVDVGTVRGYREAVAALSAGQADHEALR